jgi:hypothetical protein
MNIPVLPYKFDPERYTRELAWHGAYELSEFHGVRNDLLNVLRNYGTVGPMGEFSLEDDCHFLEMDDPNRGPTVSKPTYSVVDGQYSRHRAHRVEADSSALKRGLLRDVISMLRRWQTWEIYFALTKGAIVVFHDHVEYDGDFFRDCRDIEELEARCGVIQ